MSQTASLMLSERYRPTKIAAMVGNEEERLQIVEWLKHWKIGSKPLMLTGPPGIGKSTSIYAVASQFGYTVVEYNASDVRTRDRLREALSPTLENKTLFGDEKLLIFLDEIDGLSGRSDYAGMDFVMDFIENATLPVAMAANMEETQKLKKIEQKSLVLRFKPIAEDVLFIFLKAISSKEGLQVPSDVLAQIARSSRGDVRQALNSLQTFSGIRVVGSKTDHQFMSDSSALDAVLKSNDARETLELLRQYEVQPYERVRSIFDSVVSAKNLSLESKAESLDLIAEADVLLGRINRKQSWRLLRYLDRYLARAVAGKKISRTDSSIPWNLRLSIWNDGRILREVRETLSEFHHVGKSELASLYIPYEALYLKNRPEELEEFLKKFGFGDSEKRTLLKLAVKK